MDANSEKMIKGMTQSEYQRQYRLKRKAMREAGLISKEPNIKGMTATEYYRQYRLKRKAAKEANEMNDSKAESSTSEYQKQYRLKRKAELDIEYQREYQRQYRLKHKAEQYVENIANNSELNDVIFKLADEEFHKRFVLNEFGHVCSVYDRTWVINDLRNINKNT